MISPGKNIDLNSYLLTDDFSEEGLINIKKVTDKNKSLTKNDKKLEVNNMKSKTKWDSNLDYFKSNKNNNKSNKSKDSNVEFIIVEDDNDEKKLVINLELKLKDSFEGAEVIKIDFEICKEIYMELIKELLK